MSDNPITLAFVGEGEVTLANVSAELNDMLGFGPENDEGYYAPSSREIHLIFPASKEHLNPTIETILDWSAYAQLEYTVVWNGDTGEALDVIVDEAEKVIETDDIPLKIANLLKKADGEAYLVIAWADGSVSTEIMLDRALAAGVKCKDITAGMDDISFRDEDEEPVEQTTAEPTPAKEEPLIQPEVELTLDEQQLERDGLQVDIQQAMVGKPDILTWLASQIELHAEEVSVAEVALFQKRNQLEILLALRELLETAQDKPEQAAEPLTGAPATPAPKRTRGRPRADGSPAVPKAEQPIAYLKFPDGTYRLRGRGKPPADSEAVMLTPEQVVDLLALGLIEE